MLFFKRILKDPEPAALMERRGGRRYLVNPRFPLQALLNFVGHADSRAPQGGLRSGWKWKGRIIDCSEEGARISVVPAHTVEARDLCDLKLTVEEFELTIPCQIVSIEEQTSGLVFGLKHTITDELTRTAYRQLLEVFALGFTLKVLTRPPQPDGSGYLLECYASDRPSRLSVWRHPKDQSVVAFEFQLKDSLVRVADGHGIAYLTGTGAQARPATEAKAAEIRRLFNWVLPNLSPTVSKDVREYLGQYGV